MLQLFFKKTFLILSNFVTLDVDNAVSSRGSNFYWNQFDLFIFSFSKWFLDKTRTTIVVNNGRYTFYQILFIKCHWSSTIHQIPFIKFYYKIPCIKYHASNTMYQIACIKFHLSETLWQMHFFMCIFMDNFRMMQ